MDTLLERIENQLDKYIPYDSRIEKNLLDSMKYSLNAGGKRIRPLLTIYFCELCGGDEFQAMPFACAVEMIHTYSLIHDDLPCMDNDDMRRGKPSNHKAFGENTALLAGDALQSLAFEICLSDETVNTVGASYAVKAAHTLAEKCGYNGMVGGQIIDLEYEDKNADINILREMDNKKTGALISAACEIGCIVGGGSKDEIEAASVYAKNIGLAFQIMDDILDVTADPELLGKPTGSDSSNKKSTYVSLLGIDECKNLISGLTAKALDSLSVFKNDTSKLRELALALAEREK